MKTKTIPGTYATTQRTSKTLKLQVALSNAMMILAAPIGTVAYISHGNKVTGAVALCVLFFVAGFVWRVIVNILIWWHHE